MRPTVRSNEKQAILTRHHQDHGDGEALRVVFRGRDPTTGLAALHPKDREDKVAGVRGILGHLLQTRWIWELRPDAFALRPRPAPRNQKDRSHG